MNINYSPQQKETENQIRSALMDILSRASSSHLDEERLDMLKDTIRALEDTFLVVVVGEFNAGKSSFINALLRTDRLKEGVTPTTAKINLIRFGDRESAESIEDWGLLLYLPEPLLESISFVDTPGTNTVVTGHEILTRQFLPHADMVLFLTSSDRPFSESESHFMETIRDWGKKTVIVVNKMDLLQNDEERTHVLNFVRENARKLFGDSCPILPVSTRLAKKARAEGLDQNGSPLWEECGFADLERFIQTKMDERSRFTMKMTSAIGVGTRVCDETAVLLRDELSFYREDVKLVESIRGQVALYHDDMRKEIDRSMAELNAIFAQIRQRGNDYFDEFFKVKHLPGMMKKDANKLKFQENVLKNMPTDVERKTAELAEMIGIQQQRMMHIIRMQIESRKSQFPGALIPEKELNERAALLQRMQNTIDEMLVKVESDIALNIGMKHAQSAVTTGLAIEVSAIGIGAALTAITTTVAADLLGIVAAFWVGFAGLLVLPYYKKKSKTEFSEKINDVEEKLLASLRGVFTEEVNAQMDEMDQALRPFERFVLSSVQSAESAAEQMEEYKETLSHIKKGLD